MNTVSMWRHYMFRAHRVMVIQQWKDPFGQRMLRFASAAPGEEEAQMGMPEEAFLAEAVPLPPDDPEAACPTSS